MEPTLALLRRHRARLQIQAQQRISLGDQRLWNINWTSAIKRGCAIADYRTQRIDPTGPLLRMILMMRARLRVVQGLEEEDTVLDEVHHEDVVETTRLAEVSSAEDAVEATGAEAGAGAATGRKREIVNLPSALPENLLSPKCLEHVMAL